MTVPASCPTVDPTTGETLIDPVIEMFNLANPMRGTAEGFLTVIGGHVYRGSAVPQLDGRYVFGAYSTQTRWPPAGAVYTATPGSGGGLWTSEKVDVFGPARTARSGHYLLGFGQDLTGEVYVLTTDNLGPTGNTGRVYRLASDAHRGAIDAVSLRRRRSNRGRRRRPLRRSTRAAPGRPRFSATLVAMVVVRQAPPLAGARRRP